jgi:hypothetical protein
MGWRTAVRWKYLAFFVVALGSITYAMLQIPGVRMSSLERCKAKCHPLDGAIRRVANSPTQGTGWRGEPSQNYGCICGAAPEKPLLEYPGQK